MSLLGAFEDFLVNYKSTATDLEALEDLNLDGDGDGTSDEYDFVDDVAGGKEARQRNGNFKEPKRKYLDMLQKVADREMDEVTIELDDLDNVILPLRIGLINANRCLHSTRRPLMKPWNLSSSTQLSEMQSITLMFYQKPWTKSCPKKLEKCLSRTTCSTS